MASFKAKTHQIRVRLRLRPRPRWDSLRRFSRPPPDFRGPTSKAREGKGAEGRLEEGQRRGEKEREGEPRSNVEEEEGKEDGLAGEVSS